MTLSDRAKSIYSVSRQLASQYNKKRQDVETNALPMLYQPYEPFTEKKYQEIISFTEQLLQDNDYEKLIVFSEEIVALSVSGLRYYHEYYQGPLLILVTLSFLGWAVCLLRVLAEQKFSLQFEGASKVRTNAYRMSYSTLGGYVVLFTVILVGSYLLHGEFFSLTN